MSKYRRVLLFETQTVKLLLLIWKPRSWLLANLKTLFISLNWELNKVSLCRKLLVNIVNWWSCVILIAVIRVFEAQCRICYRNASVIALEVALSPGREGWVINVSTNRTEIEIDCLRTVDIAVFTRACMELAIGLHVYEITEIFLYTALQCHMSNKSADGSRNTLEYWMELTCSVRVFGMAISDKVDDDGSH